MEWFSVDKQGLAQLLERKGKPFILYELVQNAWDEETTQVDISIQRIGSSPFVLLTVTDDNPEGFADLRHAFTLFAQSNKKADAEKRGRFNLGEKLVLALCRRAEIVSTKGTILFDESGRRTLRKGTNAGSIFRGELRMTEEDLAECRRALQLLIPPAGITTKWVIGGQEGEIRPSNHIANISASLQTEIADAEGNMRKAVRRTDVLVYNTQEQAHLYEMGIPVVEIDGRFDVNVMQKIPLNFDRDNVPPAYLAKIHALTVENVRSELTADDANATWVKTAIEEEGESLSNATIRQIVDLRFGYKRVAYDPSDVEANNKAVAEGYKVIHGGALSKAEWAAIKRADAILPAGQVTPTKPENFVPANEIAQRDWTLGMHRVARYAIFLADKGLGFDIRVRIINSTATAAATYGNRVMTFNLLRLGHKFFEGDLEPITDLVIHELGHEYASNHLSEDYYHACTNIGAKFVTLALQKPEAFNWFSMESMEASRRTGMFKAS